MKKVVKGRLYDDAFMWTVGSRTFQVDDPVTREPETYREELKREYALKDGHTLADTWVEGGYGRRVDEGNCDLRKGQFVLERSRGWNDGVMVPLSDAAAKDWIERFCDVGTWVKAFGEPENPWTGSGEVRLVEAAESRASSMKWDKERAEERARKAESELEALKARLGEE